MRNKSWPNDKIKVVCSIFKIITKQLLSFYKSLKTRKKFCTDEVLCIIWNTCSKNVHECLVKLLSSSNNNMNRILYLLSNQKFLLSNQYFPAERKQMNISVTPNFALFELFPASISMIPSSKASNRLNYFKVHISQFKKIGK